MAKLTDEEEEYKGVAVDYGMGCPSDDIEYDVSSLKEEEPNHDDFNIAHEKGVGAQIVYGC
ncbi:hypothetical protein [Rhizobium sp. NPDC090279]|uniref:hypothetical protein n=1 Tax=Rhizobium sp. NPDC090279 TaxID=3364499 RepID=UPI00383B07EE